VNAPERPDVRANVDASANASEVPPRLELRPAARADVPVLWEMVRNLAEYERMSDVVTGTADDLARLMFDEPGGLYGVLAWDGSRAVGYALYFDTFASFRACRTTWLEDLFVTREARGTGAGRLLLAEVARRALARGSRRLAWVVLDWNEPAIQFYARQGATRGPTDWLQYRLDEGEMRSLAAETS
jgi:GNAT superfamily N-acetyltransferase